MKLSAMSEPRQVVAQFWAAMDENDWSAAADLFADAYVLEWPQSGERIVGRENFMAANANYPSAGRWSFTLHRILAERDTVVTEVSVSDGVTHARVITFSTVHAGKILHQREFRPEPFAAPAWRTAWAERDKRA